MKTPILTRRLIALAGALFVGGAAAHADSLIYTYDTDLVGTNANIMDWNGGWGKSHTATWDGTVDAAGSATSGSVLMTADYTGEGGTGETVWQSWNGPAIDMSLYDTVSLDVYFAETNRTTAGDFGRFDLRLRVGGGWPGVVFNFGPFTNAGWNHLLAKFPPEGVGATPGFNLHWYAAHTNNVNATFWLDNVTFSKDTNAPPPPPPALAMEKIGPGLEVLTCGSGDYSRKNVATPANVYLQEGDFWSTAHWLSWLNTTGAVTYAMTVTEASQTPGLKLNIIIAGNPVDALNTTSPDWNYADCINMEAQIQANGHVDVNVWYKTNAPNSHGIRYTPEGLLISVTNTAATSFNGTWALTCETNRIEVTGPGGIHGTGYLPAEVVSTIPGPYSEYVYALFGLQPETKKYEKVTLTRVKVSGSKPDFLGGFDVDLTQAADLDSITNKLIRLEEEPEGIYLRPANSTYRLSWQAPDDGFNPTNCIWSAPAINGPWANAGIPANVQIRSRAAFVTSTNTSGSQYFFRLKQ